MSGGKVTEVRRDCLDALRRLRCDAVCLHGECGKVVVRGTVEESMGYYEVCLITDTPLLQQVCGNSCCDGYFEEPEEEKEVFVLEEFCICLSDPKDNLDDFVKFLNRVLRYRVCPCARYFIKDSHDRCVACHMTLPPEKQEHFECPVCYERVQRYPEWASKCSACSQTICAACAARVTGCPLCRKQ